MRFNYLSMIWDVKILLAKIKDSKGTEIILSDKKKLPTKIPPKCCEKTFSICFSYVYFAKNVRLKMWVKNYFNFTRKDRVAIVVLLALILIAFVLPKFFPAASPASSPVDSSWITAIRKLELQAATTDDSDSNEAGHLSFLTYDRPVYNRSSGKLFEFDPNTLDSEGWKKLGLRDKTIGTIQRFLQKGGRFDSSRDLQRIYGLHRDDYKRLAPYVKINRPARRETSYPGHQEYSRSPASNLSLDINTADTTAWIALPGIGSKLAARIVNFREKLGGFNSISQVAEVYGLADSTYKRIEKRLRLDQALIKKININIASVDELKVHPYIRYAIASAIVAYRNEHGLFSSVSDLKKIGSIDEAVYWKIEPYMLIE